MANSEDFRQKFKTAYHEELSGEFQKLRIVDENKIRNGMTLILSLEDHTLGNLLRMQLLKNK